MPELQFEDFATSLSRLPDVIQSIPDILRNPAANPLQAALLVGIVLVLALVVLLSVLLIIMNPSRQEQMLRPSAGRRGSMSPVSSSSFGLVCGLRRASLRRSRRCAPPAIRTQAMWLRGTRIHMRQSPALTATRVAVPWLA
jgi:hypothetical protein